MERKFLLLLQESPFLVQKYVILLYICSRNKYNKTSKNMKNKSIFVRTILSALAFATVIGVDAQEKKEPNPVGRPMKEPCAYQPPVVTPGSVLKDGGFTAPSDAIILFDGKDLSKWERTDGTPS